MNPLPDPDAARTFVALITWALCLSVLTLGVVFGIPAGWRWLMEWPKRRDARKIAAWHRDARHDYERVNANVTAVTAGPLLGRPDTASAREARMQQIVNDALAAERAAESLARMREAQAHDGEQVA